MNVLKEKDTIEVEIELYMLGFESAHYHSHSNHTNFSPIYHAYQIIFVSNKAQNNIKIIKPILDRQKKKNKPSK